MGIPFVLKDKQFQDGYEHSLIGEKGKVKDVSKDAD